jgi:hypothetical protein
MIAALLALVLLVSGFYAAAFVFIALVAAAYVVYDAAAPDRAPWRWQWCKACGTRYLFHPAWLCRELCRQREERRARERELWG